MASICVTWYLAHTCCHILSLVYGCQSFEADVKLSFLTRLNPSISEYYCYTEFSWTSSVGVRKEKLESEMRACNIIITLDIGIWFVMHLYIAFKCLSEIHLITYYPLSSLFSYHIHFPLPISSWPPSLYYSLPFPSSDFHDLHKQSIALVLKDIIHTSWAMCCLYALCTSHLKWKK